MKTKWRSNRLLSIVLCLCMVLSILSPGVLRVSAADSASVTVYCINSGKWGSVHAHAWGSGAGTTWPGEKMTKTGDTVNGFDVYAITFNAAYENVIFNNGAGTQTGDMVLRAGQYYDYKDGNWYESLDDVPALNPLSTGVYLAGSFNGWNTSANEFQRNEAGTATGYVSLELEENTEYQFKVVNNGSWLSCNTAIAGTVEGLAFTTSVQGNTIIKTVTAGTYVFGWNVENSKLSVTYPESGCSHAEESIPAKDATCTEPGLTEGVKCSLCGEVLTPQTEIPASGHAFENGTCTVCGFVAVTVYMVNSENWDSVYAHAWSDSAGTTWPGLEMTKTDATVNGFDVYEIVFDVAYEKIIFNSGSSQTDDLELKNGQYYDYASEDWYESLDEVPVPDPLSTDCYLVGGFNGWNTTANEFRLDAEGDTIGCVLLELEANTKYEFKVIMEGVWTSCATPITGTVEGLIFGSSVSDNATITTVAAGTYVFGWDTENSQLSVTYPEISCSHEEEIIPGEDATCTENGLTEGVKCSICGKELVPQEVIPSRGHEEPEYTNNGETHDIYYDCCGEEVLDEPHTYTDGKCDCGAKEPVPVTVVVSNEYGTADTITLSNPTALTGREYVTTITSTVGTQIDVWSVYVAEDDTWYGNYIYEFDSETGVLTVNGDYVDQGIQIEVVPYVNLTVHLNGGAVSEGWQYTYMPDENGTFVETWACGDEHYLFRVWDNATETMIPGGNRIFEREGYTLSGYNTAADGSGTAYAIDGIYDLTQDTEVYLIWECIHSWNDATCAAPKTCSVCGATEGDVVDHSFENGACIYGCGTLERPAGPKFSGACLVLEADLTVSFAVKQELLNSTGYENPYVVYTFNGAQTTVSTYSVSSGKLYFAFENVSPDQMNDTIYATLYASYDGNTYECETREYSVAAYCYNMLSKCGGEGYEEFRTLIVDLLNYGAESQKYSGHNADTLVNVALTQEQKAWGTSEDRTLETVQDSAYATIENPTVQWKCAGLNLVKSVAMRLKISAQSVENLTVKVEDSYGNVTTISEFVETEGGYFVYVDTLTATQMSKVLYLTVYEGETPVSNTARYSIESYAYAKQSNEDAQLAALVKAMMKYGDSAKVYFN